MKYFTSVADVADIPGLIRQAIELKNNPLSCSTLGQHKTLGLVFMNPSFRTRLSTQKAARLLGMDVVVLNVAQDGWKLELQDGAVMDGDTVEHIKDAAAIMGLYCDVVGLRCFPGLSSKETDTQELVLKQFMRYCQKPFISLESATRHPLQSLADAVTIHEHMPEGRKAKVVLSWAPHIKPLPQAVANSFSEWMCKDPNVDFTVCHPPGYALDEQFTEGAELVFNQRAAIADADFVYVKNWSSFSEYGRMPEVKGNWMLNDEMLGLSKRAHVMHCLPVRRNVEVPDALLDSSRSLILKQAENRVYAAEAVLKQILEALPS